MTERLQVINLESIKARTEGLVVEEREAMMQAKRTPTERERLINALLIRQKMASDQLEGKNFAMSEEYSAKIDLDIWFLRQELGIGDDLGDSEYMEWIRDRGKEMVDVPYWNTLNCADQSIIDMIPAIRNDNYTEIVEEGLENDALIINY